MPDSGQESNFDRDGALRAMLAALEPQESEAPPDIALTIAKNRAELGDLLGAEQTLAKAIERYPNHVGLAEQCAQYRLKLGRPEDALTLLAPLEADARPFAAQMLARARAELGDTFAAAETLARAYVRHPESIGLAEQCARYRLKLGDAQGALAVLAPMTEILTAPALVVLARAAAEIGNIYEAEAIIVRGLERLPGDLILTGHLAELRLDAGRSREAVALLAQIEDSAAPAQLLLLAKARLFSGDPMAGLATLERGVERHPANPDLLEGLASALLAMGDAKFALSLLDQVAEPRGVKWFIARGQAYEVLGDVAGHEAAVRQGIDAFPADLHLLAQLSKSLSSQGKLQEAAAVSASIEDNVIAKPDNISGFVTSHFIFGDAQGAADLVSRIVSKLDSVELNRTSAKALIDLIAGARLLLPDIGVPILKRILARIDGKTAALTVEQQIVLATACGATGDIAGLRAYLSALIPQMDRVKDIIEAVSLAAWADDAEALATLEDLLRKSLAGAQRGADGVSLEGTRLFWDRELGAGGFSVEGRDVAILFPGLYSVPSVAQQKLVLGLLARGIDVVRLVDVRRDVFLSGIGPLAGGRSESATALKRFVSECGYRRTIIVGTSGGGMPAAIYGDAIAADRIVVFSTGTVFPPDDDPLERRARAFLDKVRKPGLDIGTDNLEIWQRPGPHPELHIHYPMGNRQDARHALRMRDASNVFLYPVETAQHNFYSTMSAEALADAVLGTPKP
jgi:predicted Zn-dependent protease